MLALGANGRGRAGLLSALRPQDVFATSLYTGTGASQLISTPFAPDFVWEKSRSAANSHSLFDRLRGNGPVLNTASTAAEAGGSSSTFATLEANGFRSAGYPSGQNVVGWSFRRAPKFFDTVTYTGDGTSGRVIPHALGIKPGMIIVKRRDNASAWYVTHRSLQSQEYLLLNGTNAVVSSATVFQADPDATSFTIGSNSAVNAAGSPYVAYIFAHDPDTTNGIVQCGSLVLDSNGAGAANLGYGPQWVMFKQSSNAGNWIILDTARGWGAAGDARLFPNLSSGEDSVDLGAPNSTGFSIGIGNANAGQTLIYMAIRAPIT